MNCAEHSYIASPAQRLYDRNVPLLSQRRRMTSPSQSNLWDKAQGLGISHFVLRPDLFPALHLRAGCVGRR